MPRLIRVFAWCTRILFSFFMSWLISQMHMRSLNLQLLGLREVLKTRDFAEPEGGVETPSLGRLSSVSAYENEVWVLVLHKTHCDARKPKHLKKMHCYFFCVLKKYWKGAEATFTSYILKTPFTGQRLTSFLRHILGFLPYHLQCCRPIRRT